MLAQEYSHHHGILIKSVQSAASANMTKNGKQIATVNGHRRPLPWSPEASTPYENPTKILRTGRGFGLEFFGARDEGLCVNEPACYTNYPVQWPLHSM